MLGQCGTGEAVRREIVMLICLVGMYKEKTRFNHFQSEPSTNGRARGFVRGREKESSEAPQQHFSVSVGGSEK